MSKEITKTGEMWIEKTSAGNIKLGFTQGFLDKHQNECWHIIPQQGKVQKGMVLLSLETNDGLVPVTSPYDGDVVGVAHEAINFPEKLTESKEVVVIKVQEEQRPSAKTYLNKNGKQVRPATVEPLVRVPPPTVQEIDERLRQQQVVFDEMMRVNWNPWGGALPGADDNDQW